MPRRERFLVSSLILTFPPISRRYKKTWDLLSRRWELMASRPTYPMTGYWWEEISHGLIPVSSKLQTDKVGWADKTTIMPILPQSLSLDPVWAQTLTISVPFLCIQIQPHLLSLTQPILVALLHLPLLCTSQKQLDPLKALMKLTPWSRRLSGTTRNSTWCFHCVFYTRWRPL